MDGKAHWEEQTRCRTQVFPASWALGPSHLLGRPAPTALLAPRRPGLAFTPGHAVSMQEISAGQIRKRHWFGVVGWKVITRIGVSNPPTGVCETEPTHTAAENNTEPKDPQDPVAFHLLTQGSLPRGFRKHRGCIGVAPAQSRPEVTPATMPTSREKPWLSSASSTGVLGVYLPAPVTRAGAGRGAPGDAEMHEAQPNASQHKAWSSAAPRMRVSNELPGMLPDRKWCLTVPP